MAARKRIISIAKTTAAAAGLAVLVAASPAGAELIYHLTLCGGPEPTPGSPCYVQSVTIAPPQGSTDGLTDAAILNFLVDQGIPAEGLGEISHGIEGANSAGYVWGNFNALDSAYPLFVFRDGEVVCCTDDGPWTGISINDNGLVIGSDPDGLPFISPLGDPTSPSIYYPGGIPDLDAASTALLASLPIDVPFWDSATFLAIDDTDRVSGVSSFGAFLLTPANLIPEPASGLLILSALAILFGVRRVKA